MIKWSSANAAVRAQLGDPLRVKRDWDADRIFKMASLLLNGRVGQHQVQNVHMSMGANIEVAFRNFVYEATAQGNSDFQQHGDMLLRGHGEPTVADADRGIVTLREPLTSAESSNLKKQAAAVAKLLLKNAEHTNAYCSLMTAIERTAVLGTAAMVNVERFTFLRDYFIYFMEEMAIVSHALLDGIRLGLVLRGGTKRDWELSRTNPVVSPFDQAAQAGGRVPYEKRQRTSDGQADGGVQPVQATQTRGQSLFCQICGRTAPTWGRA
jgi:hypothetical protein